MNRHIDRNIKQFTEEIKMAFKYEETFNLVSNQRKQPKGIVRSVISQITKVYIKGYSKLVRIWLDGLSRFADKSLNCSRL